MKARITEVKVNGLIVYRGELATNAGTVVAATPTQASAEMARTKLHYLIHAWNSKGFSV